MTPTGQRPMTPTGRLVRCPKCRELLCESADISIYRCGGCGAILQAKSRKNNNNNEQSDLLRNGDAPIDRLDNDALNGQSDLPMHNDTQRDVSIKTVDNGRSELPENGDASTDRLGRNAYNGQSDLPMSGVTRTDKLDETGENGESNLPRNGDSPRQGLDNSIGDKGFINPDLQLDLPDGDNLQIHKPDYPSDDKGSMGSKESIISETTTCNVNQDRESILDDSIDTHSECNEGFDQDHTLTEPIVKEASSEVVTQRPAEVVQTRDHVVSPDKRPEQLQSRISHAMERVMSRETIASTEYADPNSEFGDAHQDLDDSPPRRSYHVYDGSVSSDDIENHSLRNMHLLNHLNEQVDHNFSKARLWKGEFQVNDLTHSNYEVQHPEGNFLSNLEMEHNHKKKSKRVLNGMSEPMRRGYSGHQLTRSKRPALPPCVPIDHRTVRVGCEDGDPPKGYRNFQLTSSSYFNDLPHYPEPDKMKLLRMVYELEDQLKRSCQLDDMGSGRASLGATWQEQERFMYLYNGLPEEDTAELNFSGYSGRYMVENSLPRYYASSQRPFSRETTRSHQLNHSRFHRFPSECRHSEPLPRHTSHNESLYGRCTGRSVYAPYNSLPSSPPQYMDREFLAWDSETRSEDQMSRFQEERYFREKTDLAKRHFRPKAGGAPFVTCYRCSKVLQLPEDFLVLKKRCHHLKCGACSAVLKFSLQDRIHVVPYVPKVSNPPPSEADDLDEAYGRNFSSAFHVNHSSQTERMSYYDDYGVSISQSYSTEGHMDDIRTLHDVSSTQMKGRKNFGSSDLRDKGKKPLVESADLSEIEEIARRTGSPLHQLMGYTSVSQVFRGREPKETHANS